ncbi:MAG: DsbA family protein [Gammaproteobacteria bacterium]|nr:DsbA family protein [Gammaproteobacteria bacterium]
MGARQRGRQSGARAGHGPVAGHFVDGRNIATAETVAGIAAAGGRDEAAVREALADPANKDALRERTDAAGARGIFGSPYFIVDGEPFWGQDRVEDVIRWARGERW